jgi:hypothetical protein
MFEMKNLSLATVFLVAGVAACSSAGPAEKGAATATVKPEAGAEVQSVTPCAIHTGYSGDEQCILPPDPSQGFQFHYGPSNYDDPKEVAKFLLMPGEEVTDCVFFVSPNATDVYFNAYHSRLRPGSHHMLLYLQNNTVPEGGPSACNQGLSRNLFGATTPTMDAAGLSNAPENDGLAVKIAPHQQVAMQMHVINVGSTPILREGWANVMYVDKSRVKVLGDPIFFTGGISMSIPVGQTVLNHGTATVPSNAAPDFRLVMAIPHVHAHTTRVTAYATIGGVKQKILEQYGQLHVLTETKLTYFDSKTQNLAPDPATQTPGAYSGDLYMKPGDTIDWECEQTNDGIGANGVTFTTPLQFTEQAYTGEMCNLFGMYAPTTGSVWNGFGL